MPDWSCQQPPQATWDEANLQQSHRRDEKKLGPGGFDIRIPATLEVECPQTYCITDHKTSTPNHAYMSGNATFKKNCASLHWISLYVFSRKCM